MKPGLLLLLILTGAYKAICFNTEVIIIMKNGKLLEIEGIKMNSSKMITIKNKRDDSLR